MVSLGLCISRLSTSTEHQCLVFFPPKVLQTSLLVFLGFVWAKCLGSIFLAGLHSAFYELWKDIKTADTSIRWCQLSVAVIELLHLSQGRGEVWPRAARGSSAPAHTSLITPYSMMAGPELTPGEQSYWMKPSDFDCVTFNTTSHSLNGLQLNQ